MPAFTKREKHVAVIFIVVIGLIFAFGNHLQSIEGAEHFFLLLFVLPLGAYIATDPERRQAK